MTTLVWFRNDLRVADNPALIAASERGSVVGCFVVSEAQWREHDVGDRRIAFLGRSVNALSRELAQLGIPLEIVNAPRFSDVPDQLLKVAKRFEARRLVMNAEYPLNEMRRDEQVRQTMSAEGVELICTHGGVTMPPGAVRTKQGTPYSVFGAFKRRWLESVQPGQFHPLDRPRAQAKPIAPRQIVELGGVPLKSGVDEWPAGERVARGLLDDFVDGYVGRYAENRDFPSLRGTSSLSPHLSVGAISSNHCLHAAAQLNEGRLRGGPADVWIDEIIWREFYRHVVALFPHVSMGYSFRREYDAIPWRQAPGDLAAWQAGETGYPLVDAGMRQLRQTGWMHNRLRMVTAMFLTKHLLIDWRQGERFFMQQLVDGDFAANNGGWQWSASTGTDAAPYFRVFNPTTQGKRFDPSGEFVREMLPELQHVPDRFLWEPHKAGRSIDYPEPIVEHAFARLRAIETFQENEIYLDPAFGNESGVMPLWRVLDARS